MEGGGSFILCHSVSLGHCPIGEACLAHSTCQLTTLVIPPMHESGGPSNPTTLRAPELNWVFVEAFSSVSRAGLMVSTLTGFSISFSSGASPPVSRLLPRSLSLFLGCPWPPAQPGLCTLLLAQLRGLTASAPIPTTRPELVRPGDWT